MRLKHLLTAAFITGVCVSANAQQRPYYTQYIMNNFIINPAVAGIENYTDVKLSHRHQWVGLDGAPVTTYLTVHAPFKKSDYERETATTFHAPDGNPRGKAYWEDYTAPENHSGIGLTVLNDRTGPLNNFLATVTYAYHIGIGPKTSLSAGISAGVANMRLDASKLQFYNPIDPAVAGSGYLNKLHPDVSAGLWLYSNNYFVGLAAQQIVPQKLSYSKANNTITENGKLVPHLFLSAGYKFYLSDDVTFLPSTQIRYVSPLPLGFDVNTKFQYQDLVWVGASYRYQDGFAGMAGVNLNSSINIGYSYDLTTSRLKTVSKGTHEILIGFLLNNKYGDWCPKNIW